MTVKQIARYRTRRAIKEGSIKIPVKCDDCGREHNLDCHHNNYDNPLDVSFLCSDCHGEKHRNKIRGRWDSTKIVSVMTCQKCEYSWTPRVPDPVTCPRCKNPDWKNIRKR